MLDVLDIIMRLQDYFVKVHNYTLTKEELASLGWFKDLNSIDDIDKTVNYFY